MKKSSSRTVARNHFMTEGPECVDITAIQISLQTYLNNSYTQDNNTAKNVIIPMAMAQKTHNKDDKMVATIVRCTEWPSFTCACDRLWTCPKKHTDERTTVCIYSAKRYLWTQLKTHSGARCTCGTPHEIECTDVVNCFMACPRIISRGRGSDIEYVLYVRFSYENGQPSWR